MMKKLLLLIVLALISTFSAIACSCSKLKKLTKADLMEERIAIVGRVIEVIYIGDHTMKISFEVEQNLINEELGKTVEIWSGRDCEPHFISGDRWYIFTDYYQGRYWSSLCSRSAQLTDRTIPENPGKDRYRRQAQRDFNKNQQRARREIKFLRKIKGDNKTFK
ncbi:MAG TPA: hypothetical protein VD908_10110 [Cytophagales bacterium]|nr:hypothetical protein [Cytophagales bacterium]